MKSLSIFILVLASLVVSCSNKTDDSNEVQTNLQDYFFPSDSLDPYIYVYAEEGNPLDEKIYRIYKLITPDKEQLIVERYNSNFRITEGYTYDLKDDLEVYDHMVVDAQGEKRKAKLTKASWFPVNDSEPSVFISDFPAHIDSLVGVYKSEKKVVGRNNYEIFNSKTEAVELKDEVTLSFVNPTTKNGSSNSLVFHRVYAKGFGLTEWFTEDKKIHYKLKRILSNDWWKEHAQGPSVKGFLE